MQYESAIDNPSMSTNKRRYEKLNVEKSLRFIDAVRKKPVLWKKSHKQYKNATLRNDAWAEIAGKESMSPQEAKNAWKKLLACYRTTKAKLRKSQKSGVDSDEEYVPRWFGFQAMAFLGDASKDASHVDPQPTDDPLNEKVANSEITTLVNIRDKTVVCKSIDGVTSKPAINSLSTDPKPQTQVANTLRIDRRSHPWMNAPVPVKRTSTSPVQDPLRIKPKAQTQLYQDGTQAKPVQNVHRVSLGGRPTLNPSSVKSFVNLIEHELGELSSDYATMAQVDIYKIIGEYKLKDVRRSFEKTSESEASEPKKAKIVHPVVTKRNEHTTVKIEPPVELECEEDAS